LWRGPRAPINVVTSLFALLGIGLTGWAVCSARRLLYPERRPIPAPIPVPPHTVHTLHAADGAPFDVWLLEASSPRGRILLCHGYHANRLQVLGIADGLRGRGFETLLIELRGHGDRPGPCTLGVREAQDVLTALAWVRSRPGAAGVGTGVLGLSMGATVVCQAAARDGGVRAVVTDSPYSRLFPVLRRSIRERYRLAGFPWAWLTWWAAQLALGRRLAPLDLAALAPQLRQPLFVIQGGEDRRVVAMPGREFYEAWAGPKERWFEPTVAHVGMFARQPEEYCRRVAEFFTRALA
jgi:alpha-beta hydrolase superfamily lysophospholipase